MKTTIHKKWEIFLPEKGKEGWKGEWGGGGGRGRGNQFNNRKERAMSMAVKSQQHI